MEVNDIRYHIVRMQGVFDLVKAFGLNSPEKHMGMLKSQLEHLSRECSSLTNQVSAHMRDNPPGQFDKAPLERYETVADFAAVDEKSTKERSIISAVL